MCPPTRLLQFASSRLARAPGCSSAEPLERRVLLSAAAAPAADTVFHGHTYRLVLDTAASWTDAKAAAEAAGGHLVTINSAGEQAFVEGLLAGADAPTGAYKMGGHVTSVHPLRFGWTTGEPLLYRHWDPTGGEPNSAFGPAGTEPVMAMLWTRTPAEQMYFRRGFWNDELEAGYRPGASIFDDVNQAGYVIEKDSAEGVYEAERATVSGAVVSAIYPDFSGSGYVDYRHGAGDAVEFTVNVPSAGRYALDLRYANGGVADRSAGLSVNGTAVPGGVNFARTGSWRTWNTISPAASLLAGSNTVRVTATGQGGPNLDALSPRPIESPAPATYQAESATLSGPVVRSNHSGFTGGGFADYQHAGGDSVEFAIDAPADGNYALDFRYANGTTADRPLELRVDGQVLAPRLSFAPTAGWGTWSTTTQSILLTAGSHTVRLTAVGSSGPNLDALTVRPAV